MMLKLIVFDCDGVMFDSFDSNIRYYNDMLKLFGHPAMSAKEAKYCHMATVRSAVEHIFRHYPQEFPEIKERVLQELNYEEYRKYMRIEPDLRSFLDIAYTRYRLAISTNRSDSMVPLLKEHDLEHYFSEVMTACTAPKPKPAPDGLRIILKRLEVNAADTLFIGDSELDKMQAEACGVDLVAFKSPDLDAKYHVSSFMEMLELSPLHNYQ